MNTNEAQISLTDLAAELGIEQTPTQPYSGVDVLRNFDSTIPADADSVSAADAELIREAWAMASDA